MKNAFIIPARAGSKGIINKNITPIQQIPMFVWSIIHAKYIANKKDIICVSSDSDKYLKIAESWGAMPRLRPSKLATDRTPTEPVIEDVVNFLNLTDIDNIILLQPTSPLRSKISLNLLKKYINSGTDSVVSVFGTIQFEWNKIKNDFYEPNYTKRLRRQDSKPRFIENGSIYSTKVHNFKKYNNRVTKKSKIILMNDIESIEVDNLEQLSIVNSLSKEFNKQWSQQIISSKKLISK